MKVTRNDVSLIRRTLHLLTATQKAVCLAVIVVTAVIWWFLVKNVLTFGRNLDYNGLQTLGAQTVAMLQQYNPVFWWAIVALSTILLAYIAYGIIAATQRSVRHKTVSKNAVERLANQLSEAGREVLIWSWSNDRDPITVGVLQTTLAEMRSGRANKITLAREQAQLLKPNNKNQSNSNKHLLL